MTSREVLLARVRDALGPAPDVREVPRDYRTAAVAPVRPVAAVVAEFCDRVAEYRATVVRVAGEDELIAAVAQRCAERGSRTVAAAPGLAALRIPGVEVSADCADVAPQRLDGIDAALTGCALAIAQTGTVVLDGGGVSGRRALTLVPDHHVCVVRARQIVAGVPDAIAGLHEAARDGRPVTMVSGPSATSDIELDRVDGVHGPRMLDVVVVG